MTNLVRGVRASRGATSRSEARGSAVEEMEEGAPWRIRRGAPEPARAASYNGAMSTRPLSELGEVRWELHAQPPWNQPQDVAQALRALAEEEPDPENARQARLLHALGNPQRGTYYPVALAAIPFLGGILRERSDAGRRRALDVLSDLLGSLSPEVGFHQLDTEEGQRPLEPLVNAQIRALQGEVERCLEAAPAAAERAHAEHLLALLRQDAAALRVLEAADELMDVHAETFRRLAL